MIDLMRWYKFTITFVFSMVMTFEANGDQYHYSNILIGDRAIGLGGAYTAISDDASGVFYNPAGLGFALSNDVSGSANAIYTRKVTYKKTIGDSDFVEKSKGTLPSFFGGLQKLDHLVKGLVFAFGMYTTDSELKDQDDVITGANLGIPSNCLVVDANNNALDSGGQITTDPSQYQYGGDRPALILDRFHRTVNQRGSTFFVGGALGWRFNNTMAVGFGLNYVTIDELVQEYQDVRTSETVCNQDGGFSNVVTQKGQNIRQHLLAYALQPTFGFQASLFDRVSLGLTVKLSTIVSQSFEQGAESRSTGLQTSDQDNVDSNPLSTLTIGSGFVNQFATTNKDKDPLGKTLPSEIRLGLAYFASTRLLVAYDMVIVGASDPGEIIGVGNLYKRNSVLNHALGAEYYLAPAVPVRIGLFTNNDARPEVQAGSTGQPDHVDFLGYTFFLAWVQPNSQVGAGVILQDGTGKAQKVGGSLAVQDVEASSFTFAFSATHSF